MIFADAIQKKRKITIIEPANGWKHTCACVLNVSTFLFECVTVQKFVTIAHFNPFTRINLWANQIVDFTFHSYTLHLHFHFSWPFPLVRCYYSGGTAALFYAELFDDVIAKVVLLCKYPQCFRQWCIQRIALQVSRLYSSFHNNCTIQPTTS